MTAIAVAAMMTFSQFRLFSISEEKAKIFPNYTYYVHEQKISMGAKNRQRGPRSLLAIVRLYWLSAFVVSKSS
jgi:hypothetical protein